MKKYFDVGKDDFIILGVILLLLIAIFIVIHLEYERYKEYKKNVYMENLYLQYSWLHPKLYLIIRYNSIKYDISEGLVCSLIQSESNGKQYALSKSKARGYMQIMPFHYPKNPNRLYEPILNIEKGCDYLRKCLNSSGGNLKESLRKYNQGIHGDPKKYKNWKNYVFPILSRL